MAHDPLSGGRISHPPPLLPLSVSGESKYVVRGTGAYFIVISNDQGIQPSPISTGIYNA